MGVQSCAARSLTSTRAMPQRKHAQGNAAAHPPKTTQDDHVTGNTDFCCYLSMLYKSVLN